jgi:group II intron reverse transcriptase/maturase
VELLEKILTRENLNEAYKRVYANKGASGVDGVSVEELHEHLRVHKAEILESIRTRKYKPQPVRRVEIPKEEKGKVRKLGIPAVVDRVIQQAIAQVLTPIYEEQFSNSSYGFRPGRSCEMAVIRSLEILNDGYDWVVDIDLERFFDTVNHDRLMNLLHRTIEDGDVLSLIRKFLVSGVMIGNTYEETTVGTPQGGNLSPLLSNVILNELDKELEARGLHFVRYADDCNIFVRSGKAAERIMKSITDFIEKKLGLKVNATKSQIGRPKQIKFLGFGYNEGEEGKYHAVPHKLSVERLKRKLRSLTSRRWGISLDERLKKLKQQIIGWVNYFRIAVMKWIPEDIDRRLRVRIRVIIWKQWKVPKKRYESLRMLGISARQARIAYRGSQYQRICKSPIVHAALTNKRLESRGLISLSSYYANVHLVTTC